MTAPYTQISYKAFASAPATQGMWWSPDGLNLFIIDGQNELLKKYSTSIAWDLDTLSYVSGDATLYSYSSDPTGIFITSDGMKAFICTMNRYVTEYSMSVAWDLSTFAYVKRRQFTSLPTASSNYIAGIFFNDDGTKMFLAMYRPWYGIREYSLSTPYDVATAVAGITYDDQILTEAFNPISSIWFTSDGKRIYVMASSDPSIATAELGTAWDLSTAPALTLDYVFAVAEGWPYLGVIFSPDETKMFSLGEGGFDNYYAPVVTSYIAGDPPVTFFWTNFNKQRELV